MGKDLQGMTSVHQKYYAKLARCYYGPFQILAKINETAYRLKVAISLANSQCLPCKLAKGL